MLEGNLAWYYSNSQGVIYILGWTFPICGLKGGGDGGQDLKWRHDVRFSWNFQEIKCYKILQMLQNYICFSAPGDLWNPASSWNGSRLTAHDWIAATVCVLLLRRIIWIQRLQSICNLLHVSSTSYDMLQFCNDDKTTMENTIKPPSDPSHEQNLETIFLPFQSHTVS